MEATQHSSADHGSSRTVHRSAKGFEQDAPAGWVIVLPVAMTVIVLISAWIGTTAR